MKTWHTIKVSKKDGGFVSFCGVDSTRPEWNLPLYFGHYMRYLNEAKDKHPSELCAACELLKLSVRG
jgi:hypothetical protein